MSNQPINVKVTQEDIDASIAIGACGGQIYEFAINRDLDRPALPSRQNRQPRRSEAEPRWYPAP